jgi:hypothetical protein
VKSQLCAVVLGAAVLLVACGSGGETAGKKVEPTEAATSYFARTDTDAINAVASRAQKAGARAQARASTLACNKSSDRGYQAWRACWHLLLDPFGKALGAVATEFGTLAGRDFPEDCGSALGAARERFTRFATKVDGLLAGIDSQRRPAQVKAMKSYNTTLTSIAAGYTKPFQSVTKVCYSPKDLASINAKPTPGPTPSKAP